ncbi:hypothetical protein SteCoe_37317 [Stentor coeruleus]|uniref:Uncharacterized protein n=1 Tax=Stentor coeruleus TaxID=5963 RepID=A0A1R2AN89_9CILI|nr:hypothetical protein SteCoe_37317 [Stentor coeruleus]
MCNFNHSCPSDDGSCNCYMNQYLKYCTQTQAEPFRGYMDIQLAQPLMSIILSQSEKINELSSLIMLISQKLGKSQSPNSESASFVNPIVSDEIISEKNIIEYLCGNSPNFTSKLKMCGDIPNPAYKDRAFPMMVRIVDNLNNEIKLQKREFFKIMLFAAERPLKPLILNKTGEKVVLGTLDADGDSSILFKKIIIKEVSSHFRNGSLFLVVKPENDDSIKPLIIPNFIVKARKMKNDILTKKPRFDEAEV